LTSHLLDYLILDGYISEPFARSPTPTNQREHLHIQRQCERVSKLGSKLLPKLSRLTRLSEDVNTGGWDKARGGHFVPDARLGHVSPV